VLNVAREVVAKLIDDLEGGEAEETVAFALDGTSYEIDLSSGKSWRSAGVWSATSPLSDVRADFAPRGDGEAPRRLATAQSRSGISTSRSCGRGPAPTA
jgi:nucleoid-associated protein Lsr2